MISLNQITKKKVKIVLCGAGILVAMSILATTPPLSHDSASAGAKRAKAAALKAPADGQAEGIDLTSAGDSSRSASGNGYSLQGSTVSQASDNSGNPAGPTATPSSGPAVTPTTEPDMLYPIDPTPKKCELYKYPGGMQPYSCPVCENAQTSDGIRYPCGPCYGGSTNTEIACVMP
jgi:hypothetical protein